MSDQNAIASDLAATNDRNFVVIFTLASLFFGVFSPLVGYFVAKDGTTTRKQIVELLNFQITVLGLMLIAYLLTATLILSVVGIPLAIIVGVADVIMLVLGAIRASRGESVRYRFTLRLLS
ncbi:DUF4870 domain-containing protein [Acidiphilium cryptum]|uniref:DUF4870 domain-containing protein n=1 Tax=Acidiphilium cryptum (strain JF-5) TaxID=349163 RepID=A5FYA1_ACICJ|nr:DUF4870 domain-containing protein [Acidiphilium cryptum]ABQ30583.1 hypothetical protein Acry_1372 [Acidiphilium cryptum JF-5]